MCLIKKRKMELKEDLVTYKVLSNRGGRFTSPLFDETCWILGQKNILSPHYWGLPIKDDMEHQMRDGCGFHSFRTLERAKQWIEHWEHTIKMGLGRVAIAKCHIPATADFVFAGKDQDTKVPAVVSSELIIDEII